MGLTQRNKKKNLATQCKNKTSPKAYPARQPENGISCDKPKAMVEASATGGMPLFLSMSDGGRCMARPGLDGYAWRVLCTERD